jgi:hypothetical protein
MYIYFILLDIIGAQQSGFRPTSLYISLKLLWLSVKKHIKVSKPPASTVKIVSYHTVSILQL